MKKASMILSHLSSQPQFKLLKKQECYQKFIALLTPKWQKAIAFVYVKNMTLFVAVKHPGFKMELNYNRDLLKSLLTQLTNNIQACESLQANNVVIFHSKYHPVDEQKTSQTTPHYQERAQGDFTLPTDDDLKEKFERIKSIIRCKP
jgi:hypothetical protein